MFANNKLAVMSTIGLSNQPQSALVAFVETEFLDLLFQTSSRARKYANLLANRRVSFVVGFGWITVQFDGNASPIPEDDINRVRQMFEDKNSPTTRYYLELPDTVIFKASPTWMRYSNYEQDPPVIMECFFS